MKLKYLSIMTVSVKEKVDTVGKVVSEKKPRSEKQLAAFAKAREVRAANIKARKDLVADCIAKGVEVPPPAPRRRKSKKAVVVEPPVVEDSEEE